MSAKAKTPSVRRTPTPQVPFSTHRPSTPAKTITMTVPEPVIDKLNSVWTFIYDKNCPFGSIFMWLMGFLAVFYLFILPDMTLNLKDNGTLVTKKVDRTLRGWLFISVIASALAGHFIIKNGCATAGVGWSFLWFLVALLVTMLLTQLILSFAENISIPNAVDFIKQVTQSPTTQ